MAETILLNIDEDCVCTLKSLVEANEDSPIPDEEIEATKRLPIGGAAIVRCGANTTIRRVAIPDTFLWVHTTTPPRRECMSCEAFFVERGDVTPYEYEVVVALKPGESAFVGDSDDGVTVERARKVFGRDAIEWAERNGVKLSKHTDPTEDACDGLTPDEAREIAKQDPGLVYVTF